MDEEPLIEAYSEAHYIQLVQVRVPLEEAADAFSTRDANGRIPVIVIPEKLLRIRNDLVIYGLATVIGTILLGTLVSIDLAVQSTIILIGLLLLIFGTYRSFIVRVPEGASALLTRGGRFIRTIPSGSHVVPPWVIVSHVVTRREIPFDVPVLEAPTGDNVRASIEATVTFAIIDPYAFVYNVSAADFDHVFQAACQETFRTMVRRTHSNNVLDLINVSDEETAVLHGKLNRLVQAYGVEVRSIIVTFAQPVDEFMQSLEGKQLAQVQQHEQAEVQALAKRRQADAEALAHQEVIARVARAREQLQEEVERLTVRRTVVELEAEAEALRLAKLQERLEQFPQAAQWEMETMRLQIAQALAGNTRAVLQIGEPSDIVRSFVVRDVLQDSELTFSPPLPAGVAAAVQPNSLEEPATEPEPAKPRSRRGRRPSPGDGTA